jgi:hypothetical protein
MFFGGKGIDSFFRGGEVFPPRCIIFIIFLRLGPEKECEILIISQGFIIS